MKLGTHVAAGLMIAGGIAALAAGGVLLLGAAAATAIKIGMTVFLAGSLYVGEQALSDIRSGRVSDLDQYTRKAVAGSVVGFLTGASGLLMAEASLLGVLALGFGEGLVGSIVTQKLLNEDGEIDWGVAIEGGMLSLAMAGFMRSVGRSVKGVGGESEVLERGLNSERIEYYLGKARNNIDSDTVVLGSTGKYDIIAETEGYTYFKMSDDVWTSLEKEAGGNYDEIWKVNQQFIDEQIAVNKNILLSNDPYQGYYFDDGARRFYQREIDYILSKGYTFESTSDGLWKAVRK